MNPLAALMLAMVTSGAPHGSNDPEAQAFEVRSERGFVSVVHNGNSVVVHERGNAVARMVIWLGEDAKAPLLANILLSQEPPLPTDALPDGERGFASSGRAWAWLVEPTKRYGHGVLGDAVEAGGLAARGEDGSQASIRLPENSVFEDRFPRLADIDGDGQDDIVVVRSYLDAGAAVSVWTLKDGEIVPLGESAPIGTPNRWLNPAGIADFDGDGRVEIAAVITPHIGGTLKFYELREGRLVEEAAEPGFSNHEIGSRVLGMSAVLHGHPAGPLLAVPDNARSTLRIVAFHGGRFSEWQRIAHKSAIATDIVAYDLNGDGRDELIYALKDGRLIVVDGASIGAE